MVTLQRILLLLPLLPTPILEAIDHKRETKPLLKERCAACHGTINENLPSFMVMTDPQGGPIGSASNWSAGYMPAAYQGTLCRGSGSPLLDLATSEGVSHRT